MSSTNFSDRGPAVFAVTTATLVVASIFVAARIISRAGIVRNVSWDDYLIILAWLFAFFLSLVINLATEHGLGRYDSDISLSDRPMLRIYEYVFSVLYNPALMVTKTSILVFYLRLANNTQRMLRIASWVVLVIVNIAGTILTIMNIFQCRPISASWDINTPAQQCIPLLTEFICSAPINITTDLAILALPIPVLTGMRLPPRQKTILVITFAFGIFVTIVDVVRIYYLQQAINTMLVISSGDTSAVFGESKDFPWNASLALMWSAVEVNTSIACACVPTLKPLVIKILPDMLSNPRKTRRGSESRAGGACADAGAGAGIFAGTYTGSGVRSGSGSGATGSSQHKGSDSSGPQRQVATVLPAAANCKQEYPQEPPEVRLLNRLPPPGQEISVMDFLNSDIGPDEMPPRPMGHGRPHMPSRVTASTSSASTPRKDSVYFGFVNMRKPKSMLKTSGPEAFMYCAMVAILFFLWGFSYGLLNTLNNAIAGIANMSLAETVGLTSAYFGGGYFFGPLLVGEWILRHDEHHRLHHHRKRNDGTDSVGGFKTTFIAGLLLYGLGTIMFWPSAVLNAFGGFMVSSFVVGFGLAVLETAANPFLFLCGPPQYGEARLLIAQGVQAVGSVLSGVLADNVFFTSIGSRTPGAATTLLDVQWTYLAVTLLCVLLALFFYYTPLPEVADRELSRLASRLPVNPKKRSIGGLALRTWSVIIAVTAQWTYVAAQECMSIFFQALLTAYAPEGSANAPQPPGFALSVLNYLLIAHTAFATSRFLVGFFSYLSARFPHIAFLPKPRTLLAISTGLTVLFALLVVVLRPARNPNLMAVPVMLFFFAEGPLWPLIFALGLRGQGGRTKRAAAWLTMGGSGPAFWPFVQYAILQRGGGANASTSSGASAVQNSFILVIALVVVSLVYPIFLAVVRDARALVDPLALPPLPSSDDNDSDVDGIVAGARRARPRWETHAMAASEQRRQQQQQQQQQQQNHNHNLTRRGAALFGNGVDSFWEKVAHSRRGTGSSAGKQVAEGNGGTDLEMQQQQQRQNGSSNRHRRGERSFEEMEGIAPDEQVPDRVSSPSEQRRRAPEPWEDMVLDTKILDSC